MNQLSTILRWVRPARAMEVGNMPTCATNMVALPFASSSPTYPVAVELGSASILLAVVGMLRPADLTSAPNRHTQNGRANKGVARNVHPWKR
jgi:hypothetical protein